MRNLLMMMFLFVTSPCLLFALSELFTPSEKSRAFEIKSLPVGLELSDGDHAALYGWPDLTVDEAVQGIHNA